MNLPSSPRSHPLSSPQWPAALAACLFVAALLGFGAALEGYSQTMHPIALLGARGVPWWWGFDALGFVVPGVLAWWSLVRTARAWESASDKGASDRGGAVARIGWTLCAISALAFALQGMLPVDASRGLGYGIGRLHAAAWTVWWIAFVAGAVALAVSMQVRDVRVATLFAAAIVLAFAMFLVLPGAPALGQRIAFSAWFAWVWWVARRSRR